MINDENTEALAIIGTNGVKYFIYSPGSTVQLHSNIEFIITTMDFIDLPDKVYTDLADILFSKGWDNNKYPLVKMKCTVAKIKGGKNDE